MPEDEVVRMHVGLIKGLLAPLDELDRDDILEQICAEKLSELRKEIEELEKDRDGFKAAMYDAMGEDT